MSTHRRTGSTRRAIIASTAATDVAVAGGPDFGLGHEGHSGAGKEGKLIMFTGRSDGGRGNAHGEEREGLHDDFKLPLFDCVERLGLSMSYSFRSFVADVGREKKGTVALAHHTGLPLYTSHPANHSSCTKNLAGRF
jgi:hypothetical protein